MEVKVKWGNLDPAGIVFYPNYFAWIDEATHHFFEDIGLPLIKMMREQKIAFGVVEANCQFITPGKYYDILNINTSLKEIKTKTITLAHEITNNRQKVANGKEIRACIDISTPGIMKAVIIPEDICQFLTKHID